MNDDVLRWMLKNGAELDDKDGMSTLSNVHVILKLNVNNTKHILDGELRQCTVKLGESALHIRNKGLTCSLEVRGAKREGNKLTVLAEDYSAELYV